jgi:cell division protein FtsI/penicillin-binding protein 2
MSLKERRNCLPIVFVGLTVILFGLLGWRLVHLQFTLHQQYTQSSQRQRSAVVPEQPRRGLILDAKGRILAASSKTYNAFAEPRQLAGDPDQLKQTALQLQGILNQPGWQICQTIGASPNPGYIKVKEQLSHEEKLKIQETRIPGVGIETDWQRYYPAGNLAAHVLGFVGAENTGLSGLEMKYESYLAGRQGSRMFVVDNYRRPIGARSADSDDAQDGLNLVLTIDSVLQRFMYEALQKQLLAYEAESAVGIMMNPWTGAVLAMVSLPDYDPDNFSTAPADAVRNRILTDPYEPGSIFKPIVAAVALEAGAIRFEDKFYCENGFWSAYRGIHDFEGHQYGNLSVREIIMHSSNIGMAKIGLEMTKQQLYDGLRLFGFSQRTGIDLPGEDPGLVWSVPRWSKLSITRIPFGHEVLVTPLQICRAYSIMANGGYAVKPHIVRAIVDQDGTVIEDRRPAVKTGYILKPEVAEWMVQKALVDAVREGTGDQAIIEGAQVFGKTGTANIALPTGGYDTRNYVSSFVGGAPADHPAVVLLVSIRKPNRSLGKGYSGGRVAAPVAREILENTLNYLGLLNLDEVNPQVAQP